MAVSVIAALIFWPGASAERRESSHGSGPEDFRRHFYLGSSRHRSGQAVIVLQMSLCLVLLIAAGLLLRTLRNLEHINLGMNADSLLVFGLYKVARRTPEIGIRMALGAQRFDVLWMVLRESLVLCVLAMVIGLPAGFALARFMRSMLYGLEPGDPIALAASLAGIAAVALAASFLPARKASAVDPMVALRCE
jgi:FtsX-like permease family